MSSVSGYDAIFSHMPSDVAIDSVFCNFKKMYPRGLGRLLQLTAKSMSASSLYNAQSVEAEARLFLRAWKKKPHLVHYSYGEPYVGNVRTLKKLFKSPIAVTNHQPASWWNTHAGYYKKYQYVDKVICLTEYDKDFFNSVLPGKAVYIPHGVDVDFFKPAATKKSQFTVVFSGRYLRDTDTLAKVVKKALTLPVQICFDIIYTDKNRIAGTLLNDIKDFPNVNWYTGVSENRLREIYQQAHCCMIPLVDCTANNAILEAMACGLPVISTNLPAIKTYLDSSFAILGAPGNVDMLLDAILALQQNETQCVAMGQNARTKAVGQFDWRLIAAQTFHLFSSLVA